MRFDIDADGCRPEPANREPAPSDQVRSSQWTHHQPPESDRPAVPRGRRVARRRACCSTAPHLIEEALAGATCRSRSWRGRRARRRTARSARWRGARQRRARACSTVTPAVLAAMSPVRQPSGIVAIARRRRARRSTQALGGDAAAGPHAGRGAGSRQRRRDRAGRRGVRRDRRRRGRTARADPYRLEGAARVDGQRVPAAGRGAAVAAGRRRARARRWDSQSSPRCRATGRRCRRAICAGRCAVAARRRRRRPLRRPPRAGRRRGSPFPMRPPVESLNVATAAALIAYEAQRQRASACRTHHDRIALRRRSTRPARKPRPARAPLAERMRPADARRVRRPGRARRRRAGRCARRSSRTACSR